MPNKNRVALNEYETMLHEIGFSEIRVEDVSTDVFPGLRGFLKDRGIVWRLFEKVLGLYVVAGARYVIVNAVKL